MACSKKQLNQSVCVDTSLGIKDFPYQTRSWILISMASSTSSWQADELDDFMKVVGKSRLVKSVGHAYRSRRAFLKLQFLEMELVASRVDGCSTNTCCTSSSKMLWTGAGALQMAERPLKTQCDTEAVACKPVCSRELYIHIHTYIIYIKCIICIYIYIHPTIAKGSSSLNLRKRTPFGSSQDASPFVELIIIVYNCIYLRSVLSLNILTNKRNKYYKYIYIHYMNCMLAFYQIDRLLGTRVNSLSLTDVSHCELAEIPNSKRTHITPVIHPSSYIIDWLMNQLANTFH